MNYTLYPYQRDCLAALQDAPAHGISRPLCVLPTGAGKTAIFTSYLAKQPRGTRSLILVNRDELVQQTLDKLRIWAPDLRPGIVKADQNEAGASCVIGSVQTLQRPSRLAQLGTRDLIIVDEAHHCELGNSWHGVLTQLGTFRRENPPITSGWTATPYRANNAPIVGPGLPFQACVYAYTLPEAITQGYLVGVQNKHIYIEMNLDHVKKTAGDWSADALGAAMLDADAPTSIVEAWQAHADGKRTLVFTPNVAMARATEDAFSEAGIMTALILGTTPVDERQAIYQAWRQGMIDVVVNVMVLTEGFDEPSVECIVIARPTTSKVLYVQMVGRGLRKYPGKEYCLILDTVGACHRHELMSMAGLYGLAEVTEKATAVDGANAVLPGEEPDDDAMPEGAAPASQAELFRRGALQAVEVSLYQKSPMRWIETRKGAHVLPLKAGVLRLRCLDVQRDLWRVELKQERQVTVLARELPLAYAQGLAEATAREHLGGGAQYLVAKTAHWRTRPASAAQQQFARKIGLDPVRYPTMGQLSDAITSVTGDW